MYKRRFKWFGWLLGKKNLGKKLLRIRQLNVRIRKLYVNYIYKNNLLKGVNILGEKVKGVNKFVKKNINSKELKISLKQKCLIKSHYWKKKKRKKKKRKKKKKNMHVQSVRIDLHKVLLHHHRSLKLLKNKHKKTITSCWRSPEISF